jgi:hypothetical protein
MPTEGRDFMVFVGPKSVEPLRKTNMKQLNDAKLEFSYDLW